jgi:2'-hydroxyisoflavone reductase
VPADRTRPDAYDLVRDREWDAVIDVSRQPGQVRTAVSAMSGVAVPSGRAAHYLFVSSISVYADHRTQGQDENIALLPPLAGEVMGSMAQYGEAKVACEQHVLRGFRADGALVARAGLIGGPGDWSGRTGYWPLRFAEPAVPDGSVLVPDAPDLPPR